MKATVLAAVAVFILADHAIAQEFGAGTDVQRSGGVVKLAMGPTSAAHLPGGTGGSTDSTGSALNCSSSTCVSSHKKIKHKTQHSS